MLVNLVDIIVLVMEAIMMPLDVSGKALLLLTLRFLTMNFPMTPLSLLARLIYLSDCVNKSAKL